MTSQTPQLSATQGELAQLQANAIANAITSSAVGSNTFVFFAAFDGTNNGANPPADGSGDSQVTAINELFKQVLPDGVSTGNVGGDYVPGVGTPGSLPFSSAWSVTVTAQSIANAQNAYDAFAKQATDWLATHPGGSLTSMITSFSRGGAAAAIFAQMLYENGLVNAAGKVLIAPGTVGAVSAALIIDPVLTSVNGNMEFPPTVQNLTIVRAENEYRTDFAAANYTGDNANILQVTGNHGDAGDLYDNGLGGMYLQAYTSFFQNAGLAIAPVPGSRAYTAGTALYVHSESLSPAPIAPLPGFWDATYNSLAITDPNYLDVSREVVAYGTNGVPVTVNGSATSFTGYDGNVVLGGTGGNYTGATATVFDLLPGSTASVTGTGNTFNVASGAQLTYTNSSGTPGLDAMNLSSGASVTLNGSNEVIDGSKASIALGANDKNVSVTGEANSIAVGAGAAVTVSGLDDAVSISGSGNTIAGDAVTLSGGSEQIVFAGLGVAPGSNSAAATVIVKSGSEVTIQGTDGTLIANNNSTGSGAVENTINWTGGGSQEQFFSGLPSGVTEEDENYSGADGTGSLLSTVIVDNTPGMDSVTVSGGVTAAQEEYGVLGALVVNTADKTDTFTLPDGLQIAGIAYNNVTDPATSPGSQSPQQILSGYLDNLDYAGTEPSQLNFAYLNPTGTAYTVTPSYEGLSGGKAVMDYVPGAPGAVMNGQATFDGVSTINIVVAGNVDLSQDTISGIPYLYVNNSTVALTSAQFNAFTGGITGTGDLVVTTGGSDSLAARASAATVHDFIAESWDGTTLTGSALNGQTLTASLFGDDVLTAGNGAGDVLVAGEGVDTLTGGTGGDFFEVNDGLAPGSSITGNGTANELIGGGDISQATVSGVSALQIGDGSSPDSIALNATEFAGLTSITGTGEIIAATASTYSLAGMTFDGVFPIDATANTPTTLTGNASFDGNAVPDDFIASGNGNDTLSGNGTLSATGNGNDTLTGDGTLEASGNGNNTLTALNANGDTVEATGLGQNTLSAGSGTGDVLVAANGTDSLTAGGGAGDHLTAETGGNTLIVGGGTGDVLTAEGGKNILVGGNGGDTFNLYDEGNQAAGGSGNNTFNVMGASTLGGSFTLAGTIISGGTGGTNTINGEGFNTDISGAVVTGIEAFRDVPQLTINASQAASLQTALTTLASGTPLIVSDTGAEVEANLGSLETLAASGALTRIVLTDTSAPTLTITAAQQTADAAALALIDSPYALDVTGVAAASAASVAAQPNVASVNVSDSAADVAANFGALATLASDGVLSSVAFTDSGTPALGITGAQAQSGAALFGVITSPFTVTLAGSTMATFAGAAAVSLGGSGDTVTMNGANAAVNDSAGGNTIALNGSGDTATVSGYNSTVADAGNGGGFTLSGPLDSGTLSGNNATLTLSGVVDNATVTGTGDTVIDEGNTVTLSGTNGAATLSGNYAAATLSGSGDTATVTGYSNTVNVDEANATVMLTDTSSASYVNLNAAGGTVIDDGTGNTTTANTTPADVTVAGSGGTVWDWGGNNNYSLTGDDLYALLFGSDSAATLSGAGAGIQLAGYAERATLNGSGESVTLYGYGETASMTGSDGTANEYGAQGTVTLSGSGATATVGGSSNTLDVAASATGASVTLSGSDAVADMLGASSAAVTFAADATGTLILSAAQNFSGTVAGLDDDDGIDLANFHFSGSPTISNVTGTGAAGTDTDVTVTDGSQTATLLLLNQYAAQFAPNASAYTLASDGVGGTPGTLFQLAAAH